MWMWLSTIAVLIGAEFDEAIERKAFPPIISSI
jgi:uncharacterized BrkB/YihY/UPF0761 family membrane protein